MKIATILQGRGPIVQATAGMAVADVVRLLAERRIGAVPVVEGREVVGVFSERDVIYGLEREGAGLLDRPVGEVMTCPAVTVSPDVALLSALAMMTHRRIRHLPVVEGDELVGFVSIGDLVKARVDHIEAEASAMRDYIQTA